jgi:hypothetical protein
MSSLIEILKIVAALAVLAAIVRYLLTQGYHLVVREDGAVC